jgi:hypothetical protein
MTTQIAINSISFDAFVDQDEPIASVTLVIDRVNAGKIDISRTDTHRLWAIDGVKIEAAYRGKGFYSQLLTNCLNMIDGVDALLSNERNDTSNAIYAHWMSQEVKEDEPVLVRAGRENLIFEVV